MTGSSFSGSGGQRGAPAWQVADQAFRAAVDSGRLDLPLPGYGRTRERWAAFADLAAEDLSLARLAEGHADAAAILAELDGPPLLPGSRWGVWAAHPPGPKLEAARHADEWRLRGTKRYCSGARSCTHALVTAAAPDGMRLFAVSVEVLTPVPGTWPATGMAGSDTLDVDFDGVPALPVGRPGAYVERPGFAHGAPAWPRAGTAAPARWAAPCCPPQASATWGRMRSPTLARWT